MRNIYETRTEIKLPPWQRSYACAFVLFQGIGMDHACLAEVVLSSSMFTQAARRVLAAVHHCLSRAASLRIPMPPKAATPPLPPRPRQQRRVANHDNNEVWARRLTHRRAGNDAITRDGRYYILSLLAAMPVAPDPEDRAVSKRAWEASMKRWREQLQRLYKEHNL